MNWQERISIDPAVLTGKPVIKGTRIAVAFVIEVLAQGWDEREILNNYPGLAAEDVRACRLSGGIDPHNDRKKRGR